MYVCMYVCRRVAAALVRRSLAPCPQRLPAACPLVAVPWNPNARGLTAARARRCCQRRIPLARPSRVCSCSCPSPPAPAACAPCRVIRCAPPPAAAAARLGTLMPAASRPSAHGDDANAAFRRHVRPAFARARARAVPCDPLRIASRRHRLVIPVGPACCAHPAPAAARPCWQSTSQPPVQPPHDQ